jgi:hypothetical protein
MKRRVMKNGVPEWSWIRLGGCGIIDPNVFQTVGIEEVKPYDCINLMRLDAGLKLSCRYWLFSVLAVSLWILLDFLSTGSPK